MPIGDYAVRKVRLYDIFKTWWDNEVTDLDITVGGVTLFTSEQVFTEFRANYCSFYFTTASFPFSDTLKSLWKHYIATTGAQLKREYDALTAMYDPLTNYDMEEIGLDGKRLDGNSKTWTPSGSTTTQVDKKKYGLESVSGNMSDSDTTTTSYNLRSDTDAETPSNTVSGDYDGVTKTGYHEANEHYFKRSGNIGVQTASDMIKKEIEIRQVNMLHDYIAIFINTYCWYAGNEIYDAETFGV